MKKKKFLFIFILLLFSYSYLFSLTDSTKIKIIADKANIYLRPDTSSSIIDKAYRGMVLDLYGKQIDGGRWYYVSYYSEEKGSILSGYVKTSLVEIVEEEEENRGLENSDVVIVKEGAVLKLKPNENSLEIKKIPLGATLHTEDSISEWFKINLPPDKDGIVITGYIHESFIELEENKKINLEKTLKTSREKISAKSNFTDQNYSRWKERLSKAKSKSSTGLVLTVCGALVFAPCMILTFTNMQSEYEYKYWGLVQVENKKASTGYIIGDAIGLTALIAGLAIHLPARKEIKKLEKEGREIGYITIGLLPQYGSIGFQINLSF